MRLFEKFIKYFTSPKTISLGAEFPYKGTTFF